MNKGTKRKNEVKENEFNLPTKHLATGHIRDEKRLIVILDGAQLETIKVGKVFELLNCDDHLNNLRKLKRDPGSCRPDITHQSLLMLLDSPLNRAGLLQVYIRTEKNILIEVNPQIRIPRTFKRFAGLMVQLLHRFSVSASDSNVKLMKVIKNPITEHLPVGCRKIGTSFNGTFIDNCRKLVPEKEEPLTIIIGAFAHGAIKSDFAEELVSISKYPLSAALACCKICSAFEESWSIV